MSEQATRSTTAATEPLHAERFPIGRLLDIPGFLSYLAEEDRLRVEEYRQDGRLVIRAEVPGIDPDADVEIEVVDGMLHIQARRTQRTAAQDAQGYCSEFRYGSFSRSLRLPPGTTQEEIVAEYADGILEVRVPLRAEGGGAMRVPVTRR